MTKGLNSKWFVYILCCKDSSYYVGITNDLNNRVLIHNSGKGPDYTKRRRPVKLVYYERFENKSLARKRELELKGWRKEKKRNLIAGFRSG